MAVMSTPSDRRYFGFWLVAYPYFAGIGQLYHRGTGVPARGVEVEFRRTGGVPIDPEPYVVRSDSFGNFPLRPVAHAAGEVVGDLIIRAPGASPITVPGVRFSTQTTHAPFPIVGRWGIGVHLPYLGRALFADSGLPATGTRVRVRRVGGIQITPADYTDTINEWGGFHLGPAAASEGDVEVEITFTPPAPYREVVYRYTLRATQQEMGPTVAETWLIPRQ
jgi:hypothetical protein